MKKQSVIGNSIAMFVGTCFNILISVITTPIITRLVDPSDYGQWSLFTTYTNVAMAVVMLGLDQSFVRFYYKDERIEYKRYLTYTVVKIPIIVAMLAIFLSLGFVKKIELFERNSWDIYLLLYANVIVSIVNRIGQLVLRMEQKGKEYSFLIVFNKIVYLLILFALLFEAHFQDLLVLTIATVGAQTIISLASILLGKSEWKIFAPKPSGIDVKTKDLIKYGLPFIYATLAGDIFNAADRWVIKALKTYTDVGIYSAAANIVSICAIVQTTFSLLWAPIAMEQYEKDPEDKRFYIQANGCITVAMFMLGAVVICFKNVIVLLLGENYRLAVTVVPFLLFNPIMTTISETTVYGINFKNKTWAHIIITSISALTNVALNMWLIPLYSSEGAAFATAISYVLFFCLRTALSRKYYFIKFPLFRFFIITIVFFVYAAINTFTTVTLFANCMYLIGFTAILGCLYKDYFSLLLKILKQELMRYFHIILGNRR